MAQAQAVAVRGCFAVLPQCDMAEFAKLDNDVKEEVLDLLLVMEKAERDIRPFSVLQAAALRNVFRKGWSVKSLERKYYEFRATGDWRVLINRAKQRGMGKSEYVTELVIEAWKTYCDRHKRVYRSAYKEMIYDYRAGKMIGDVDWKLIFKNHPDYVGLPMPSEPPRSMRLPQGWSYENLMRHKPTKIEEAASRQGKQAAGKHARHVRTTRRNMRIGQQYMFDDVLHDFFVLDGDQFVRVWELACLDVASGCKIHWGLKPNRYDDEKKAKMNLRGVDMRFLLAYVLTRIGYDPEGCEVHLENGTATICRDLAKKITLLSGGVIRFYYAGVDKGIASPVHWGAKGGGNPNSKAHLESLHNLFHNRLDHLPAQTGNNARINAPEDTEALRKYVNTLIKVRKALPADLAARLQFPVIDFDSFTKLIPFIYDEINDRDDHHLEGWDGNMERQWRTHTTDIWHHEDEWLALPDETRERLGPLVAQEGFCRMAKLSPKQVWERGLPGLVKLPDCAVALICGKDLAKPRPCPGSGEIVFNDLKITTGDLAYRTMECLDSNGVAQPLIPGVMYHWLINPFDYDAVFVLNEAGGYIGRCERIQPADRMDHKAIGAQIVEARKDLDTALEPFARRGAKIVRARLAEFKANQAVVAAAAGRMVDAPAPVTPLDKRDLELDALAMDTKNRDLDFLDEME